MQKSILLHELPLITDPETFFNTDKIMYIDAICIDSLPNLQKLHLEIKGVALRFNNKLYLPLLMKGSPEKLILNTKNGVPVPYGLPVIVFYDGDLKNSLDNKKIYDLSQYYRLKNIVFRTDHFWFYENFIRPIEDKNSSKQKNLNPCKAHTIAINSIFI
jgi:hypothetical protein